MSSTLESKDLGLSSTDSTSTESNLSATYEPKKSRFTILTEKEKICTILLVATVNTLVFFLDTIYYPALDALSEALHVSTAKIYLTITSYMVAQGIAPLLTGSLSDQKGRRPILVACLLVSIATNIGLACQTNYAALLALRCLQSVGSTGASVVTVASVVDTVTRGERGKYMAYMTMGSTIGTSVGPVLGGVLTQFLGWRSIFWFLAIFAGVISLLLIAFLRETCRAVVGDGSIPPQSWNKPLLLRPKQVAPDYETQTTFTQRPRTFDCLKLIYDKQIGLLILVWSLISWGQTAVEISIPVLMGEKYKYNSLQVGLCYIPWAIGGITARWSAGILADWNFRRLGRRVGVDVQRNQQTKDELKIMPLEKIRLQITIPGVYLCCVFAVAYSWTMAYNLHVSAPLILLFFLGNAVVGVTNVLGALVMDLQAYQPGMTRAAMTIFKCLPGAGVAAGINPAIRAIGFGWLGTIFAVTWMLTSALLWIVYYKGQKWRNQRDT